VMLAGATPAMMFKMEIVETDSEQVRAPSMRHTQQKGRLAATNRCSADRATAAMAVGRRGDARRLRPAGPPPAGGRLASTAAWRPGRDEQPPAAPRGGGERHCGRSERVSARLLAGQPHGLRAAVQPGQRRLPALGARPRHQVAGLLDLLLA
jgi:hypothetical protein